MAVTIGISIKQNSQNITNNTSNVTVTVTANWTGGSHNAVVDASGTPQAKGWVKIDGTSYDFASTFNTKKTSSGSQTICTKTVTVTHAADGTKTLSCSASYNTYISSGTVTASASKVLTTIPRKSTLTASNGTLGTAMTLKVTRQASSFTHTITYSCGSASGTICTKSSSTSISWTPSIGLSSQNTTGTSVSIKFTITTYSGSTNIGSNTKTISCSIPASVKPSCTHSIVDVAGLGGKDGKYGKYVKGLSKLKVTVSPTTSYGSAISKYSTSANGNVYTSASFTTNALAYYGSLTVSSTVTDKRGRSGSYNTKIDVIDYAAPSITRLAVKRGDLLDGKFTDNDQGDHVQVTFSASVSPLDNNNTAKYSLKYKKSAGGTETPVNLNDVLVLGTDTYSVDNIGYVFEAETDSSYTVELSVEDNHNVTKRATTVSTAYTIMHWGVSGKTLAVGKVCEPNQDNLFDIGMQTRFAGGIMHPELPAETDLNSIDIPNTYVGLDVTDCKYANCPINKGTFTLEVAGAGSEGQVRQKLQSCDMNNSRTYERFFHADGSKGKHWGEWICTSDFGGTLLWEGSYYMDAAKDIKLSEAVSKQRSGIVLVFSRYSNNTAQDYHFSYHFVPKMIVALHSGAGSVFQMGEVSGDYFASKYLYIRDEMDPEDEKVKGRIKGNDHNVAVITNAANGINYTNNATVLRYVIGV